MGSPLSTAHVETQFAWWMRQNGVTDAHVAINNPNGACPYLFGCPAAVKAILSSGSIMRVWFPGVTESWLLEGVE
ncbi:DddA-like double-stranded DNA deaminase toxin [Streptomyces sp. NPDC058391]|uniref:DddA-like double-stranded DNA deaminase toxin n=1 Tax=Streptomyces sp. NPDC058391 TaxID=3346476 RepID=UPI003660FA3A